MAKSINVCLAITDGGSTACVVAHFYLISNFLLLPFSADVDDLALITWRTGQN